MDHSDNETLEPD